MRRAIIAVVFGAFILSFSACNSSAPSSSGGDGKPLEGKRIPKGAGGKGQG